MRTIAVLCLATALCIAAAGCQHAQTTAANAKQPDREPSPDVLASVPGPAVDTTVMKARVPILMYHHIKDRAPGVGSVVLRYSVAPAAFDAQMAWLHDNGFTSITFQQLADHIEHGTTLPAKPVIISLDDGWSCGYFAAFQSLKAHNLTATYFVYPGGINAGNPGGYLSWDQLREMADAGMEIAAHTMSHPYLTKMPADNAWQEICESKRMIEQRLARPVFSLAYPFGDYNDAIIEMTKRAGYLCGISTDPGVEHGPHELFRLCRVIVTYGEPLEDFARDVTAWSANPDVGQPPMPRSPDGTPPPAPVRPQS
jgi:peptidoglycan/xylan/chitin deacetylase (PgdA/CDA1 family)